jgi:CAAX prenyl protease-like protein
MCIRDRAYTRIVWTHLSIGVLVGVVGTVQWIGMELVLRKFEFLSWTRFGSEPAFDYINFISSQPLWLYVAFISIRLLGSALIVPVFEELFWRDWLWRTIAAPNDFRLCGVGEYEKWAFWLTPLFFALVHPQWLLAVIYGFLMNILLLKTKSLGACIVAHGVTNFLLGGYVLVSWHVFGVDQWYFW